MVETMCGADPEKGGTRGHLARVWWWLPLVGFSAGVSAAAKAPRVL